MKWTTPSAVEIRMDAEISSYQDQGSDPLSDGPAFVKEEAAVQCSIEVAAAE